MSAPQFDLGVVVEDMARSPAFYRQLGLDLPPEADTRQAGRSRLRGHSYDNALAESVIGLYKTELVRPRGPWRGLDDLELATLEWVEPSTWVNAVFVNQHSPRSGGLFRGCHAVSIPPPDETSRLARRRVVRQEKVEQSWEAGVEFFAA
jgi:hypothetical protein